MVLKKNGPAPKKEDPTPSPTRGAVPPIFQTSKKNRAKDSEKKFFNPRLALGKTGGRERSQQYLQHSYGFRDSHAALVGGHTHQPEAEQGYENYPAAHIRHMSHTLCHMWRTHTTAARHT